MTTEKEASGEKHASLPCFGRWLELLLREWLLMGAAAALAVTSLVSGRLPTCSEQEFQVLFLLFVLLVTARGLHRSNLPETVVIHMERLGRLPLQLVLATFFLSALLTNDIALVVMVPLTLTSSEKRKDLLVILQALAANAGSALTPIGNPQNLFLYWHYGIEPLSFIRTILPFSAFWLLLLAGGSLCLRSTGQPPGKEPLRVLKGQALFYAIALLTVVLAVLHALAIGWLLFVLLFSLLADRGSLLVDYSLLFTILLFFGIGENMSVILASRLAHSRHVFLLSALTSQFLSNVPTALLFAKITDHYHSLLWGVNTGGFGSLFGSLANLIAYRLYTGRPEITDRAGFTLKFLVIGYGAFFLSCGLYFFLVPS